MPVAKYTGINIPQPLELETALEIYYSYSEIGNAEIRRLFGKLSNATIVKLKRLVHEKMAEMEKPIYNPTSVNTEVAYMVWGLDINKMEANYKKLVRLRGNGK